MSVEELIRCQLAEFTIDPKFETYDSELLYNSYDHGSFTDVLLVSIVDGQLRIHM